MTLLVQGMVFVTMLVTGMFLGVWVDLYRFINQRGKPIYYALLDFLFWAVITAIVFVVLLNINFLELRLYVFFSLALGLGLYYKTISPLVMKFYGWFFGIVVKLLGLLWRGIQPVSLPLKAASAIIDNIVHVFLSVFAVFLVRLGQNKSIKQENPPPM